MRHRRDIGDGGNNDGFNRDGEEFASVGEAGDNTGVTNGEDRGSGEDGAKNM